MLRLPLTILFAFSLPAQATGPGNARTTGAYEVSGGSLFSGRQSGSLFAPMPDSHAKPVRQHPTADPQPTNNLTGVEAVYAEWIRGLIATAEAGPAGYDAVQLGAKVPPPEAPTQLTIGEIYTWIKATPGQHHAIGRYQFIPATLRRLVDHVGFTEAARFSPAVQDRLADQLLHEAGLRELIDGTMTRKTFMNRLAAIWAGLPTSSGKSHYHGYAGNKATMSWGHFEAEMAKFFPR